MTAEIHLVTGASGLIGSHLIQRLVEQGCRVRALVRSPAAAAEMRGQHIEPAVGDLRDATAVTAAMQGVSHVYHCGAVVSDWGPRRLFKETNVEGTRHVVQAALRQGIQRLVHLSSAAVYGYPRMRQPIGEQHSQRSRGIPYIATKIAAERVIREAQEEHALPAVMLRPVMVFGPGCQNYVGEVVRHLKSGTLPLLDGGRHVAGLAYVGNVVDAILLAASAPAAVGQALNICDDTDVTWRQYFDRLADGVGARRPRHRLPTRLVYAATWPVEAAARLLRLRHRPWVTRLAVLELGQPQRYDIALARQLLGYAPRVQFDEAMELTSAWARQQATC